MLLTPETARVASLPLPDSPSTVGDIVGRSFRATRLNFGWLLRLLLIPALINALSWEAVFYSFDHLADGAHTELFAGAIGLCLASMILSDWELAVRKFAILTLIARPGSSLPGAMIEAGSNRWRILVLFLPTVALDVTIMLVFGVMTSVMSYAQKYGASADQGGLIALVMLGAIFASMLPYALVCLLNNIVAAIVATDRLSIFAGVLRFFYVPFAAPLLMLFCCALFGTVYSVFQIPFTLPAWLQALPELFAGTAKEVVELIVGLIQAALVALETVLWTASLSIGSAYIYNEFRMRLEGADISRRLDALASGGDSVSAKGN